MKRVTVAAIVVACALLLLLARGMREADEPPVRVRYEVHAGRMSCVARPLRVVFLADLHVRDDTEARLTGTVAAINRESPDIVVLGGDYFAGTELPSRAGLRERLAPLSRLKSRLGVVAVLGNNDWADGPREIARSLADAGVQVLHNDARVFDGLAILGVEELTSGRANPPLAEERYRAALVTQRRQEPPLKVWVAHNPVMFDRIGDSGDLLLAGHTHGGQVFPALTFPIMRSLSPEFAESHAIGWSSGRYLRGRYRAADPSRGPSEMIVSSGLGTSKLPIRLEVPPEFVTIDFNGCARHAY